MRDLARQNGVGCPADGAGPSDINAVFIVHLSGKAVDMHQTFHVSGMRCGHCRESITQALLALDERARVHVNLESGEVQVEASTLAAQQVIDAIEELGFSVANPSTFGGAGR